MITRLALPLLLLATTPVAAEDTPGLAAGLYGDANDPELSCSANPHRLSFTMAPAHAIFDWREPWVMTGGLLSDRAVYDLIQMGEGAIIMRLEGEHRRTETGQTVIWVLRLTEEPAGYCWGRTDWPVERCVAQQLRCDAGVPVS